MSDEPTCGKGLAENAALPAKMAELLASLADNLEAHMRALDLDDERSRQEYAAYGRLVGAHRAIAGQLQATATEMVGYRDLPMGKHNMETMLSPRALLVFQEYVGLEEELLALLQERHEIDRRMLVRMGGKSHES